MRHGAVVRPGDKIFRFTDPMPVTNARCCSDPMVMCPRCASAALKAAGTPIFSMVANLTVENPGITIDPRPTALKANAGADGLEVLPPPGVYSVRPSPVANAKARDDCHCHGDPPLTRNVVDAAGLEVQLDPDARPLVEFPSARRAREDKITANARVRGARPAPDPRRGMVDTAGLEVLPG